MKSAFREKDIQCQFLNHLHFLGYFSKWQNGDIFLKKKKQDLTFYANCLGRQFAWIVKTCFLKKKKKKRKFNILSAAIFTQSAKP